MIDLALAREDANSNLVDVGTVADVDAEKRVDDSFVQVQKLKFCHKVNFLSDFEHKVLSRFLS